MEGLTAALDEGGPSACLIMCFLRDLDEEDALKTLAAMEPWRDRVTGVGLDSAEAGNPPEKFARVFARARAMGLRAVAHAGEEGPPAYVIQALDVLKVERIDHGVRAMEDGALVARLAAARTPLTVCPLSNIRLRVYPRLSAHPVKKLMDAGVVVTLNSDDPAYFGGDLNANYRAVAETFALTPAELAQLAKNSFEASFLPAPEKAARIAEVEAYASARGS